jgi:putative ABC transport system permease protein
VALNVALGVMLVVVILHLQSELEESYERPGSGFSLVVGSPKGSSIELMMTTIFHRGISQGLLPYSTWKDLAGDPLVALAVPYALGDSFRGFRVVGTTEDVFAPRFPAPEGKSTQDKFESGEPFRCEPGALDAAVARLAKLPMRPEWESLVPVREAVLGFEVATSLGLKVGDLIEPTHGIEGAKAHGEEQSWRVTGVLKESRTPMDQVVLINLDSFYRIPDHSGGLMLRADGKGMDASVSSIILMPKPGIWKGILQPRLQVRQDLKVIDVPTELSWLFDQVGRAKQVMMVVASMVVLIGVISILVAIYNTMNERRREIAIMRAIGAKRATVVLTIVGEAAVLALMGAFAGLILGHLSLLIGGSYLDSLAGFRPNPFRFLVHQEAKLILIVAGVGVLAGLVPAIQAYRTDVATNLAPPT